MVKKDLSKYEQKVGQYILHGMYSESEAQKQIKRLRAEGKRVTQGKRKDGILVYVGPATERKISSESNHEISSKSTHNNDMNAEELRDILEYENETGRWAFSEYSGETERDFEKHRGNRNIKGYIDGDQIERYEKIKDSLNRAPHKPFHLGNEYTTKLTELINQETKSASKKKLDVTKQLWNDLIRTKDSKKLKEKIDMYDVTTLREIAGLVKLKARGKKELSEKVYKYVSER